MEPDIGEREQPIMKKINEMDQPIGKLIRVKDFLPSPSELAVPIKTVKVTIALTKPSVDFFKREARKHHTKYQRMIRELVDQYTTHH